MKIIEEKVRFYGCSHVLVGIVLFNHGEKTFQVNKGDRIAQLIITKITYTDRIQVEELSDSTRGVKGFGSTGIKEMKSTSQQHNIFS